MFRTPFNAPSPLEICEPLNDDDPRTRASMTTHTSADNLGSRQPARQGSGLLVLGHEPLVAETPEELLDDETTPIARFFVRNNGLFPAAAGDPESWTLTIDGEVERQLRLTLRELKRRFRSRRPSAWCWNAAATAARSCEPKPKGNPWTHGGVGCAEWTGVSLGDVLRAAGLTPACALHGAFRRRPRCRETQDRQCRFPAACRSPRRSRSTRCWPGR